MIRRIKLNIGDIMVCREPAVMETVLGSCVSVCLWDEFLKAGGMNHFLVPYAMSNLRNPAYSGQESIETLIEYFMSTVVDPSRIRAKVFGGGRVANGTGKNLDIGMENIKVAREILTEYRIPIVNELVCLKDAIKIVFCTATGRVFAKRLNGTENDQRQ